MYKYWSNKEVFLLKKYYSKLRVKDLVEMFPNRTKATIVVKALGLALPSAKLWQPEEKNTLRRYFSEAPIEELMKLLPKRSKLAILARGERLALKRNTNKPRRSVNEFYFKKWSPNMAYILGFILADGNITEGTYKGYSDALKFGVNKRDIDILEKIKQELNSKHKISRVKNAAYLAITSQKIVNDLKTLGISYRKSLREKIPNVPHKYIRDFIRGVVDGDGSISLNKRGYSTFSICGGEKTLTFIRNHFLSKFDIYSKIGRRKRSKDKKSYLFSIAYRCNSAKTLLEYLYVNANFYLERKFKLVKRALSTKIKHRKNYNDRENQVIQQFYLSLPKEKILSMLPNRTWPYIQRHAWQIGLTKNKRRKKKLCI